MIYEIVAIRDGAVAAFARPAFTRSKGEAIRSFSDEVNRNDQDNTLHTHPEDYALYYLGHFDDATGQFTCPKQPEQLAEAKTVLR